MTLAELRRRIAVELERPRQRGHRIGKYRAITRRARSNLGDASHARGMVIASGQERLPRRRAQRGGMEAVELETVRRQLSAFGVWQGPPKALDEPKPASSMRTISTLGAPPAAVSSRIGGNFVSGSLAS